MRFWIIPLALGLCVAAQAGEAPVARLAGHVVDADGRPVAGARLWLQVLHASRGYAFLARNLGTADDDGRFAVEIPQTRLPAGDSTTRPWPKRWRYLVTAWEPDHGLGWARAERGAEAEIRMTRPAVLRGRVLGADGAPQPDVSVGLRLLRVARGTGAEDRLYLDGREPRPLWARTQTDAGGRFELAGLPAGAWAEVYLRSTAARGYEWGDQWPPDLDEVRLSEQASELTIQLMRTPVITGRLLLPDGQGSPATHTFVKAIGRKATDPARSGRLHSASTDEDGRYRLTGLQPGLCTIWVDNADYTGVIGRDIAVTRGQELELPPVVLVQSGRVEGRVLDADTGEPIARAGVSVRRSDVPHWGGRWGGDGGISDGDGRYQVRAAPVETHVYAHADGYMASHVVTWVRVEGSARARITAEKRKPGSRTVHPKPGEVITGIDLYLKRGAEVTGTVIGPDGRRWPGRAPGGSPFPPSRERVMVSPDPAWVLGIRREFTVAFIGPEGTFSARGLYPGVPVVLSVFDDDLEIGGAVRATPELDRRKEVMIRLGPAARVQGRVLRPGGEPAAGAHVGVVGVAAGYAKADAEGRFDLAGGVPGLPCAVSASAPLGDESTFSLQGMSKTVKAAPGQEVVDVGDIVLAPEKQ